VSPAPRADDHHATHTSVDRALIVVDARAGEGQLVRSRWRLRPRAQNPHQPRAAHIGSAGDRRPALLQNRQRADRQHWRLPRPPERLTGRILRHSLLSRRHRKRIRLMGASEGDRVKPKQLPGHRLTDSDRHRPRKEEQRIRVGTDPRRRLLQRRACVHRHRPRLPSRKPNTRTNHKHAYRDRTPTEQPHRSTLAHSSLPVDAYPHPRQRIHTTPSPRKQGGSNIPTATLASLNLERAKLICTSGLKWRSVTSGARVSPR